MTPRDPLVEMSQAFARHNRELEGLLDSANRTVKSTERTLRFYRLVAWLLTVLTTIAIFHSCSL